MKKIHPIGRGRRPRQPVFPVEKRFAFTAANPIDTPEKTMYNMRMTATFGSIKQWENQNKKWLINPINSLFIHQNCSVYSHKKQFIRVHSNRILRL